MLANLEQHPGPISDTALAKSSYVLFLLPKVASLREVKAFPGGDVLAAVLERRRLKPADLGDTPVAATLRKGTLASWASVDPGKSVFERQTLVRRAMQTLLDEKPETLSIAVFGSVDERRSSAARAVQCAWLNGPALPARKKKGPPAPLAKIVLHGAALDAALPRLAATAEGNQLCRELTLLPPNELTPGLYRDRVRKLAREHGWEVEEFDLKRLRRMGAGAFVAVAQGSAEEDAAIVRLRRRRRGRRPTVALVGKGICFDTGGHNLKSAQYMHGMHKDMNGSAVTLGLLLAATKADAPVNIDAWLAIAQNHIGPRAYKQNDVVTALDGTTIEIVHTDAEGRMVLADALTLAARAKPDTILDFATLTGSMKSALGNRYCGIFSNRDTLIEAAVAAGRVTGERVHPFPMDADYDPALDSAIADVKQCSLEGQADHILAARFLQRFVKDVPWVHMDLSASTCAGGLGASASDVTGFGVAWGLEMLNRIPSR
jgi:leucyl aminopeptidase